jgi:hypothetical protein
MSELPESMGTGMEIQEESIPEEEEIPKSVREVVEFASPIVSQLTSRYDDFPEAFCALTTALLTGYSLEIPNELNLQPISGSFQVDQSNQRNHFWLRRGEWHIDFTGHQFDRLNTSGRMMNELYVIWGKQERMQTLGYRWKIKEELPESHKKILLAEVEAHEEEEDVIDFTNFDFNNPFR